MILPNIVPAKAMHGDLIWLCDLRPDTTTSYGYQLRLITIFPYGLMMSLRLTVVIRSN